MKNYSKFFVLIVGVFLICGVSSMAHSKSYVGVTEQLSYQGKINDKMSSKLPSASKIEYAAAVLAVGRVFGRLGRFAYAVTTGPIIPPLKPSYQVLNEEFEKFDN